ncbi:hypothetical protein C2G38_2100371 [Gigaspora rosea]|uniref:Uncharacterized protein n=1 Tax=Gigaspora rosea TaxID=44941 RepID=A0A397UST2_9GLOM|nr:hypothetical protein C2G38_2100371 [Gigaspora rosea]
MFYFHYCIYAHIHKTYFPKKHLSLYYSICKKISCPTFIPIKDHLAHPSTHKDPFFYLYIYYPPN